MRYKVSKASRANPNKRITTDKYWNKKKGASDYAKQTNKIFPGSNARVVNCKKK